MSEIQSSLNMDKLVFDRIHFDRLGFKNQNPVSYSFEANYARHQNEKIYRVTLVLTGDKKEEYKFEISLTGFFSFSEDQTMEPELREELLRCNTVSIMMPYIRSEVSLLTAQPETDCVTFPPINITKLVNVDASSESNQND